MAKETLSDHIRKLGVQEFCKRYGCTERAALAYLRGERRPRPKSEITAKLMRQGRLTFEGIYGS